MDSNAANRLAASRNRRGRSSSPTSWLKTRSAEPPEARLARWTSRDQAIGAVAQLDQLRRRLAERNREVADLRARLGHLTNHVGQLEAERHRAVGAGRGGRSFGRRVYLRLRATVGRLLRS